MKNAVYPTTKTQNSKWLRTADVFYCYMYQQQNYALVQRHRYNTKGNRYNPKGNTIHI